MKANQKGWLCKWRDYYWPINSMQKSWITRYFWKNESLLWLKCRWYRLPAANVACIQSKNDSCAETPCSSASSVYHHVNNNNAASTIFSSKPLPSKNFFVLIDWKSAPSVHHYHGKVYNLNNFTNVVVKCKTQPYRKRIRIIYSSDGEKWLTSSIIHAIYFLPSLSNHKFRLQIQTVAKSWTIIVKVIVYNYIVVVNILLRIRQNKICFVLLYFY